MQPPAEQLRKPRGRAPEPEPRFCDQCASPFWPVRHDQRFCQKACRVAHHHDRQERGAQALNALLTWRGKRTDGSLTDLARLADQLVREEGEKETARQAAIEAYRKAHPARR